MNTNIACDITTLSSEELKNGDAVARELFATVTRIKEYPNGYALLFPERKDLLPGLSYIINLNRSCCPFLRQVLTIEPERGDIWLEFTGGEGIKQFLANDLSGLLPKSAG